MGLQRHDFLLQKKVVYFEVHVFLDLKLFSGISDTLISRHLMDYFVIRVSAKLVGANSLSHFQIPLTVAQSMLLLCFGTWQNKMGLRLSFAADLIKYNIAWIRLSSIPHLPNIMSVIPCKKLGTCIILSKCPGFF